MKTVARRMGKDIDKPFVILMALVMLSFVALCHRVMEDGIRITLIYQAIAAMVEPFAIAYLLFWFFPPGEENDWITEPTWTQRLLSAAVIIVGFIVVNSTLKLAVSYYQIGIHESYLPFFFLAVIGVGFYVNLRFKNLYVLCLLLGFYFGLMRNML